MSLNEQLEDLSQLLSNAHSDSSLTAITRRNLPRFVTHLKRVAQDQSTLDQWGKSVNFDELAKKQIVPDAALKLIAEICRFPMEPPAFHAGLLHTYGYLLSTIQTPYGYKRTRWLSPTISQGFGLSPTFLNAFPARGTLLGNLTQFLNALRGSQVTVDRLTSPLQRLVQQAPRGWEIIETVPSQNNRSDVITTNLYPLLSPQPDAGADALLVYSVADSTGKNPTRTGPAGSNCSSQNKLITAFCINQATVDGLTEPNQAGANQTIRLRYNGWIDGFRKDGAIGTRTIRKLDSDR